MKNESKITGSRVNWFNDNVSGPFYGEKRIFLQQQKRHIRSSLMNTKWNKYQDHEQRKMHSFCLKVRRIQRKSQRKNAFEFNQSCHFFCRRNNCLSWLESGSESGMRNYFSISLRFPQRKSLLYLCFIDFLPNYLFSGFCFLIFWVTLSAEDDYEGGNDNNGAVKEWCISWCLKQRKNGKEQESRNKEWKPNCKRTKCKNIWRDNDLINEMIWGKRTIKTVVDHMNLELIDA